MKRFIALCCAIILTVALLAGCGNGLDKNTVVSINGENISTGVFDCYMYFVKNTIISSGGEDTEEYWNTFEIEGKKAGDVVKETTLKNVIEYTLLAQKAVEMGADNSEKMKEEQRKLYIEQIFEGNEENYLARIEELGFTDEDFSTVIMNDYLSGEYYSSVDKPEVTDEQIKEYYNKNYYRAQHILIAVSNYANDSTDGQAEALEKAKEVKAKLDNGESFEALLQQYNEDTAMTGNEDGYVFTKDTMPKNFFDAVAELEVDGISDIVETDFGYHIIKRVDAQQIYEKYIAEQSIMFADGKTTGRDEIAALVENEYIGNLVEDMKEKADIKINSGVLEKIQLVKTVAANEANE